MTSIQFNNYTRTANLSRQLSGLLAGNWSADFDESMKQLQMAIVAVNSTRLDPGLTAGFAAWIAGAVGHLKEWEGIGALGLMVSLVSLFCLWYIYCMRVTQPRNAAMIVQAFAAMEAGQSPQAWLTMRQSTAV